MEKNSPSTMAEAKPQTAYEKPSSYFNDINELKKVFDQFDANKDGKISVSELGEVMKSMGSSYSEADLHRVMEGIDSDHDGFIDLSEFATICRSSSNAATELRDAFDLYDQDRNGLISTAELHMVLNRLGMTCTVEDCARMIMSVDSDGDGSVDFEEFEKMMSNSLGSNGSAK